MPAASYILVIGHKVALGWILTQQRMAFPDARRREVRALRPGDRLFIYTTRGCFSNPTRDPSRIIAEATVKGTVKELDQPVELADRVFPVGCDVEITKVVPFREGPDFRTLVGSLDAFAGAGATWAIRLRRPLVPISDSDASLLRKELRASLRPLNAVIDEYAQWYRQKAKSG